MSPTDWIAPRPRASGVRFRPCSALRRVSSGGGFPSRRPWPAFWPSSWSRIGESGRNSAPWMGGGGSSRLAEAQISSRSKYNDLQPCSLDGLTAALFAVHDRQDAEHPPPLGSQRRDRFKGGRAARDHVLDDHHGGAGGEVPLHPAQGAVLLGRFPDAERIDERRSVHAGAGDRAGDRGGSLGEPPRAVGRPARGADRREPEPADQVLSFGGHGGLAGVYVVAGALAGGEQKVTVADRALAEEGRERLLLGHSPPRRKKEERKPPFLAAGSPPAAGQNASAKSPTVLNRRVRSRSRPVITADSTAGENRSPLIASLSGTGAWVRSCWNSSRGLRPGKGSTPVSR